MVYQSRHLPNLLLFILSSTLALGILETGLRQFTAFPIHGLKANRIPDEKLAYRIAPSFPEIDANGFRNPQTQKQVDLVAIGDSHTYGNNVRTEDSWPYQLADLTGMTVYNFGIGGYGSLQYHHLMDEAIKLKPQVIVIGLYLANDIINPCKLINTMDYWQNWADAKGFNTQPCSDADYLSRSSQSQNDRLRRGGGGQVLLNMFLSDRPLPH